MAKTAAEITDERTRAYCLHLEKVASSWRDCCDWLARLPGEVDLVLREFPLIGKEQALQHELVELGKKAVKASGLSTTLRRTDAALRMRGFEARKRGVPITDNPYVSIAPGTDDGDGILDESWVITVNDRAAVAWHIGWKQAASRGEDLFP